MEISYQSEKNGNQAIPDISERKSDYINLVVACKEFGMGMAFLPKV